MIKCTYFLISFCRLNIRCTLIITELAGSTHHAGIAGFQRKEGGGIIVSLLAARLLIFLKPFQNVENAQSTLNKKGQAQGR